MRIPLLLSAIGVFLIVSSVAAAEDESSPVLSEFDGPVTFAYLAFEKAAETSDGVLHINAKKGQGGAGFLLTRDLTPFAEHSPAIWVKLGANNGAKEIKLLLTTVGEGKRMFTYDLTEASAREFTRLLPQDALAVSPRVANEPDADFDPAAVNGYQVQGNWSADAVDVYVDRIEMIPPTAAMKEARFAHAERLVKQAERKQREEEERQRAIAAMLADAPHPDDGPRITHIGAAAPDIFAVEIESCEIVPRPQEPYVPQPGDEIIHKNEDDKVLAWDHGRVVDTPKDTRVQRKRNIGNLVADGTILAPGTLRIGSPLTEVTVDRPEAYRIVSLDDSNYASPVAPSAVYVKSKPTGTAESGMSVHYNVYLQLPSPLKEGATYTLEFVGINTRSPSVAFTHDTRSVRSEAIHATQIGYRPSDPFKRAYLSLWMGDGGTVSYSNCKSFELLDADSGETVYRGEIVLGFDHEREESIRGGKNHTQADVYYLDFHEFVRPGEYRVHVPGVGVGHPFEIADDVWARAFRTSMHGFLSHRSGIALGAPFTDYERPRPMHPADGVKVFDLDITFWNGEAASVDRSLRRLLGPSLDASKLEVRPQAWGGYMDAGDWDRRSQHLMASYEHLELLDLFPERFERIKLALPPNEANDDLPDVLNEALWNIDCYRRLQRADGGVGGGIESTSHPRPGEASWQESLLLGAFAPDPETTLRYAACAARASRLLRSYDATLAETYARSAESAWRWANANEERVIAEETAPDKQGRQTDPAALRSRVADMRALAAVELYRLTGDDAYHAAYRETSAKGDPALRLNAMFSYACLPDDMADADLKAAAIDWFRQAADDSLAYADGNAFNVTCRVAMLPVIGYTAIYSVPETTIGAVLPRAHYLTGEEVYLRGAVAATQFSSGANPCNMTFTTGVGRTYPLHPLHIDSQHAGMAPPDGITVYGLHDPANRDGGVDWAHTWYLRTTMRPNSRAWPAAEFYIDLGNWPPMNEYTVHQTFRPTSFYWGYLAARID